LHLSIAGSIHMYIYKSDRIVPLYPIAPKESIEQNNLKKIVASFYSICLRFQNFESSCFLIRRMYHVVLMRKYFKKNDLTLFYFWR